MTANWPQLLAQQVKDTKPVEWVAAGTGVLEVLLARANKVWLYPAGIISTGLYIYILTDYKLYAEALLSLYYMVMSVYGWLHWSRPGNEPSLPVSHANRREWLITVSICLAGGAVLYAVLHRFTDSTVPLWDAWVASTGWAGMWLLARRKAENWLVLNVSNIFGIPLLLHKHLPLTALLTLILFVVAIFGYIEWKKIIRQQSVT